MAAHAATNDAINREEHIFTVRTMYCYRVVAPIILVLTSGASASVAQSGILSSSMSPDGSAQCVVVDPTPTPLNVRTEPQGRIVSTISNGQLVSVLRETNDGGGKRWSYVADATSHPIGWVFREYLACR